MSSILYDTDSYKVSMQEQYAPEVETIQSYGGPRSGRPSLFFGLQDILVNSFTQPFPKEAAVTAAQKLWERHGEPFPVESFEAARSMCTNGLPLRIWSVDEGTVLNPGDVAYVVENVGGRQTRVFVPWTETNLLRVWYPSSVATTSWYIRKLIKAYLEKSGDVSGLGFKLHDFGSRGASSSETAAIGGMAHLATGAMGTDTGIALIRTMESYNTGLAGYSIPAAEHSTITSWGREREVDAYRNMVRQFGKPGAILAVVSDSYDIFAATRDLWCGALKEDVISSGATVVIRPDSGDPMEVLPRLVELVASSYGYTTNAKGYKVLNNIRFIWGDGINELTIGSILRIMVDMHGYSADNFAFGMGGALLQKVDRDTYGWAQKACAVSDGTTWREVFKDPITAPGKSSRRGNQRTENMKLRYDCGMLYNIDSFEKIQQRILSVT
jgi:nicotinamide phosphoribosyltransferase